MQFAPVSSLSLFRPERLHGESFENYKRRRAIAHQTAKRVEGPAPTSGFALHSNKQKRADRAAVQQRHAQQGQKPKFEKERKHKRKESHTCLAVGRIPNSNKRRTWRQGEPFLYLKPLAHLESLLTVVEIVGKQKVTKVHPDLKKAQLAAKRGHGLVVKAYLRKHGAN